MEQKEAYSTRITTNDADDDEDDSGDGADKQLTHLLQVADCCLKKKCNQNKQIDCEKHNDINDDVDNDVDN
eukprot:1446818-Ditylum_brightwellii.AAC.1